MFNVTVIKLRDVVKILIVAGAVFVLGKFLVRNFRFNEALGQNIKCENFVEFSIGLQNSIIRNVSKVDYKDAESKVDEKNEYNEKKEISASSILKIGMNLFELDEEKMGQGSVADESDAENGGAEENENQEKQDNKEDNREAAQEFAKTYNTINDTNLKTEVVTANPISERFNREFNGIKIKNETSYVLTDDMLDYSTLNIDKKDIIIFHTHTCESYTQSENYKYTPTRKL